MFVRLIVRFPGGTAAVGVLQVLAWEKAIPVAELLLLLRSGVVLVTLAVSV